MDSQAEQSEVRLSRSDSDALLGVVAVLHTRLMAGQLDHDLARRLYPRLAPDVVMAASTSRDLRQELHDLAERLYYALGVYAEPAPAERVPPQDDDFTM